MVALLIGSGGCLGGDPVHPQAARPHPLVSESEGRFDVPEPDVSSVSPIAIENAVEGTDAWLATSPASGEVEGYASTTSAAAGDTVHVFVNTDQPRKVSWELFRMGYYQDHGARRVAAGGPLAAAPQRPCPADTMTGRVACKWQPTFDLVVDPNWVTGQYFVRLSTEDSKTSYVPLVIREAKPRAPILVQVSVTTWQAYNEWGGSSLYRNYLPASVGFTPSHAYAVSFDRPYACPMKTKNSSCVPGEGDFEASERWAISWLEHKGLDLAYVTNLDVDLDPTILQGRQLFISSGHDEYWTATERGALDTARDQGVSMAFLAANTGYWRVRLESSESGEPGRTMVCYKDASLDPLGKTPEATSNFRTKPNAQPENTLVGVMYDGNASRTYFDGLAQIATRADHWIYDGTGVANGDLLGHLVGGEWDNAAPGGPPCLEIVAHADLFNIQGVPIPADMTVYYPTATSLVFASGSIMWSYGLSRPGYEDERVQRMFENVLAHAGVTWAEVETVTPAQPAAEPAASRPTVLAGSGSLGPTDGLAMNARFAFPAGVAAAPDGSIYVADAGASSIRVISSDWQKVSTVAGCGKSGGFKDGVGRQACFLHPTGIAVAQDGTVYVADTGNNRIRAISRTGMVSTFAGSGAAAFNDSASPTEATFSKPRGIALSADGTLFVADWGNNAIRRIDATGVWSIAAMTGPTGVATAKDGALYVVASDEATLYEVRGNSMRIVAGTRQVFGDRDGPADQALLRPAEGIVLVGADLVFADSANHKVRALDLNKGVVRTLAGDDTTNLILDMPRGLTTIGRELVVADSGHHQIARVALGPASSPAHTTGGSVAH